MIPNRPFLFMRHGESDWNVERRCIGSLDRPLTDLGRDQARAVASLVATLRPTAVFSSPLQRAFQTAQLATVDLALQPVKVDGLSEVHLGVRQGALEGDDPSRFIADWMAGAHVDGAETFADLRVRVVRAVADCVAAEPDGLALIVGHSAAFRALLVGLQLPQFALGHCSPVWLRPAGGSWTLGAAAL